MGIATSNTSVVTYDNFFLSPLIAPLATMAAETPQIATAEASITPNSSSTFSLRASQSAKNQTTATTTTACKMPGSPALMISVNNTLVPRIISPVLIKNSDLAASLNQSGSVARLLINKPITSPNTT